MTMDLNELADRVEALDGPDREIDCLIAQYLGHQKLAPNVTAREIAHLYSGPFYTASIDAAMTLLDWSWLEEREYTFELSRERMGQWVARFDQLCDGGDTISSTSATPALAITAATLRTKALGAVHTLTEGVLYDAVSDLLSIMSGDISGPQQVAGVIREANHALAQARGEVSVHTLEGGL